jgi:hypothetical protein
LLLGNVAADFPVVFHRSPDADMDVHTAYQRAEAIKLAKEVPNVNRVVDEIKSGASESIAS